MSVFCYLYRIDINFIIKVADFGLSESVGTKEYFRQDKDSTVKLPLKWLAPESMEDGVFSEKSDVVKINAICTTDNSMHIMDNKCPQSQSL